jgi:hypothetical protein
MEEPLLEPVRQDLAYVALVISFVLKNYLEMNGYDTNDIWVSSNDPDMWFVNQPKQHVLAKQRIQFGLHHSWPMFSICQSSF